MLWSSAEFATREPASCFQVKARVCVHVSVCFPHVTDMGQPLTAVETHPYRRVFSKRIFSTLQITFAALVMWNHLAVGTFGLGFFFAWATLKKLCSGVIVCVCFLLSSQWQMGKKKGNTDWRLQLPRGELCPQAARRSFAVAAIPAWKCGHLLHAATGKMLVSSSIPSTHQQFCLFMPLQWPRA